RAKHLPLVFTGVGFMLFRSFLLPVRKLLKFTLIVAAFLILCFAVKSGFSAGAHKADLPLLPTPSFVHRAATRAVPKQTATTLLTLRFENSLEGEQGEMPVQAASITFQAGVSGQG